MSASLLLILQLGASLPPAQAARQGSFVIAEPAHSAGGTSTASPILFLNRCADGCTIEPGFEDSSRDQSSIVDSTRSLSAFPHGDRAWDEVVACVQELYAPFEVRVTDEDPAPALHFEAVVAGSATELGFFRAGGVAPFACQPIEGGMSFSFAVNYDDMRELCNVVGQESAHVLGLDHVLECSDPLTYVPGCPIKAFQDIDAPCGEFSERDCHCGGSTQNSYQHILGLFGAGQVPEVAIESPAEGATVEVGSGVAATGQDDVAIARGELWVDQRLVDSVEAAPFHFAAPKTLAPGLHTLEVRIFDDRNQYGSRSIEVEQAPCLQTNECEFSYTCLAGQCVLGPGNPSGLGDTCAENQDCQSGMCATDGSFPKVCAARCEAGAEECPSSYECLPSEDGPHLCMPIRSRQTGGCSVGEQSFSVWTLLLLVCALCGTRREHGNPGHREPQG